MSILSDKELEDLRKWENQCIETHGYYLHALVNGAKDSFTGEICDDFIEGFCDVHSHGLELNNCRNIRIVCNYGLTNGELFTIIKILCKYIYESKDNSEHDDVSMSYNYNGTNEIVGKLIKDPDDDNVLRFIRIDVPNEYIQPQLQKLEMLTSNKGMLN